MDNPFSGLEWGSVDAVRVFKGKEGSPWCGLMAVDDGGAEGLWKHGGHLSRLGVVSGRLGSKLGEDGHPSGKKAGRFPNNPTVQTTTLSL